MSARCVIGAVSEKLDLNHREIISSLTARDDWHAEKTQLMSQLAEVSISCICMYSFVTR